MWKEVKGADPSGHAYQLKAAAFARSADVNQLPRNAINVCPARIEKARMVAEAIRARRVAQAWLARQHIRETTDFQFNETCTPHGDAGVVAVMWRGRFNGYVGER